MITCPIKNTAGEAVGEYKLDPTSLVKRSADPATVQSAVRASMGANNAGANA